MNEMFSQGGKGSTGILTNKQAIARKFGVKQNEVVYFSVGADLGGYKVIYDKTTQRAYSLPALPVGTIAISLNEHAVLVHSAGTVDLGELAATRREFVCLSDSFVTGLVVNTRNELLIHNGIGYTYLGALPATISSETNPVGNADWKPQIDLNLREELADTTNVVMGDALIGVKQPFTGSVVRTQHSKNTDVVSVKDFGAVGDGITDDSAAFNAAISALSTRGGSVYVPTGNYKVLNLNIDVRTLDFHGNRIGFFGDGPALSVLIGSSAISTSYVMAVTANTTEAVNSVIAGVSFRDLGFEISNALGTPFRLVNTAYAHFSNCYFKGGRNAFESAGSLSASFMNCKFSDAAQYGFYAHDGFSYPSQLSFFQCVVTSNALAGMYAINPGGLRIYGGSIENNGASSTPTFGGGILIDTVEGATGTSIPIVVSGTYFEFNKGLADLSITHANSFCNTSFSVDGCSFGQGGTYTTVDRVHIVHTTTSALRGTVSNCNFHELSGFVPTSANQYIGISGSGTGYRSIFNVNNYFNTVASAPADQTTRIPATAGFAEARIEKFNAVTGASASAATVSFSMFAATPNVQVTVVDGGANTIYSTRITAISATSCTVEVWKTTPSGGGTWTPATNTSVHILAVGPSK